MSAPSPADRPPAASPRRGGLGIALAPRRAGPAPGRPSSARHTATVITLAVVAGLWAVGAIVAAACARAPDGSARWSPPSPWPSAGSAHVLARRPWPWCPPWCAVLARRHARRPDHLPPVGRRGRHRGGRGRRSPRWWCSAARPGSRTVAAGGGMGRPGRGRAWSATWAAADRPPRLERARLQWLGWARRGRRHRSPSARSGWRRSSVSPAGPTWWPWAPSVLVPFALVAGTFDATARRIERLLVRTIVVAGLVALVEVTYLLVVIGPRPRAHLQRPPGAGLVDDGGRGRRPVDHPGPQPPRGDGQPAGLRQPAGARRAPPDLRRTHVACRAARRAAPAAGRVAAQDPGPRRRPRCGPAPTACSTGWPRCRTGRRPAINLSDDELAVVARAHVSGNAWIQVWIPALLAGRRPVLSGWRRSLTWASSSA